MASERLVLYRHRYFPALYDDADFPVGVFCSIIEMAATLGRDIGALYRSCRRCVDEHRSVKLAPDLNLFMIQEDETPIC